MISALASILTASVLVNAYLLSLILRQKSKPKQETYEVKELLHDLSRGDALVQFRRVDSGDIFIRSPRDQ